MTETPPIAVVATRRQRRRNLSYVWAVPIVTACVAAWLVWNTVTARGPLITITFDSAEGLIPNQSRVRHKAVEMGIVQKVALTPDLRQVAVTVRMSREASGLLTDKTRFWVVKPRIFAGSVSGLETLVSGSYIEMLPSTKPGEPLWEFNGLNDPPVLQADVPGRTFRLRANRIGSINLGSPVFYRDLTVGEVLGWDVEEMANSVTIHAFVRAPFDQYVHDNSRFWNASGASLQLTGTGLHLHIESLRALILGGIAFETPESTPSTPPDRHIQDFALHASKDAADSAIYARSVPLLARFQGTVAGLEAGSPVTLRGIKIGSVASVGLLYDPLADTVVAPVRFAVEPDRIAQLDLHVDTDLDTMLANLIRRGLGVRLETANLITGQKQLAMEVIPNRPILEPSRLGGVFVVPVLDEGSGDPVTAAGTLIARIGAIPFEQIGQSLNKTLTDAGGLIGDPKLKDSLVALQATLAGSQALVKNLDRGLEPVLKRLPALASALEEATRRSDRVLGSVEAAYGANSQFNRDLGRLMAQVADAARSVRVLTDLLSRHPEALIRGRTEQGP